MAKRPIVCDTTLLLYLGRINQAPLLPKLFSTVWVPEAVATELDMVDFRIGDALYYEVLKLASEG